jgi:hypothetical protein
LSFSVVCYLDDGAAAIFRSIADFFFFLAKEGRFRWSGMN